MRHSLAPLILATALATAPGCAGIGARDDGHVANPLAYEVLAPGGGRALLFGSVHLAREGQWSMPAALAAEMESAELLVLEIDLSKSSPEEMMLLMLSLGEMPPGTRMRQVVSDETWALLEERAPETGAPIQALDRLKPWVVALQFIGLSLQQAGLHPEHGVEHSLVKASPELPIRGLETPFEQFSTFDELPFSAQDRMLRDALLPSEEQTQEIEELIEAWRRGDAAMLESIVFGDRDDPELAVFYAETYDRRNARMAEALEDILQETERAFVVVGAAHLVGPRSMPHLLQQAGLQVRQVSGMR